MGQVICIGTFKAKSATYKSLDDAYRRKHNTEMQMGQTLLEMERRRGDAYRAQTEVINLYGFCSEEYKVGAAEEIRLREEIIQYKLQMEQALGAIADEIKEIQQRWGSRDA